jgi:hypothetical protein
MDVTPPPPDRSPAPLTITSLDGQTYAVDRRTCDPAALEHLLAERRALIESVATHAPGQEKFSATIAQLDEVRRLGISNVGIDSKALMAKPDQ